jgi:hypothetical protein
MKYNKFAKFASFAVLTARDGDTTRRPLQRRYKDSKSRPLMKYKIVFLLLLSQIAACTPKYVQPIEGDIARLTIVQNQGIKFVAFTYDNAANCSDRRMIKGIRTDENVSISVAANSDVSVSLQWDTGFYGTSFVGCAPTITFKPKKNRLYEISPSYDLKQCNLQLIEVLGSDLKNVEYQDRSFRQGSFDSSSFCR